MRFLYALSTLRLAGQVTGQADLGQNTHGAAVAGESALKGSLSPGKLVDMAVLSGDPLRAPVERLTDLQVEMTILNGQIVYSV